MKLWIEIILEWLNCLDILETNIKELKELDDGKLYKKLIKLFAWKGIVKVLSTENIITKFLEDEYPKYKFDHKNLDEMEHTYTTSLFLLHASQKPLFHQPMCIKLQHETQLQIKAFLEMIIPYGKNINRETLQEIIIELQNDAPKTPITPKTKTLKDFFNSPAVQSAQKHKVLNNTYGELRKLRTELEVEKFEKADLQEDLLIQQNKVQSLQKKLLQQAAEIKALQQEKIKPNTPQSCKKNKDITDSEQYKKEIDRLEDELMQKQYEIDKHEENNDILVKEITCMKKRCIYFREKLESCEKSLECMQIQGEIKDRELINLRMTNEELRTHLKEVNKTVVGDQSFEIDGIAPLNSSLSFNSSEVLSSVVEIQLKEAKEESDLLKIQLDALNKKLESTNEEHKNMIQLLKEKTQTIEYTEDKLNVTLNKLSKKVESLQEENRSLMDKNKILEELDISNKKSLSHAEKLNNVLSTEISTLKERIKDLQESLHDENVNSAKLNIELEKINSQVHENLTYIQELTDQNNLYKTSIDMYNTNLKDIFHHSEINYIEDNLDSETTIQLIQHLKIILCDLDKKYISKQMEFESLNNVMKQVNLEIEDLQIKVSKLTKKDEQSTMDILKLKEIIVQNGTKITELTTRTEQYSEEISYLKEVELQKLTLEKDLNVLKEKVNKNLQLQASGKCVQDLRKQIQTFTTEFYLIKKDILNQINEYQKHSEDSSKSIFSAYKMLYAAYTEEQLYRNQLEDKLTNNKKDLKDSQNLNITLENDIIKNKQMINNLQRELISTNEKLTESVQNLEKFEEAKDALEKQYKDLKYENAKILLDLNNINDKCKESQQEVCNMSHSLKFKDEKIGNLIAEITSLKLEKEHIIHLQKGGESKTKNFIKELETKLLDKQCQLDQLSIKIKLSNETLKLVQDKFEKLSKETIASEMKLKEVIKNLQEVRTNQDAVLTTQERAIKKKCLQLNQLEKKFNDSKKALCKQLKNEKLCQSLQNTNSKLQIQSYEQRKTIEELQEMLKEERNELVKTKEYSKSKDIKKSEIVQICEKLEYSLNDLKATITKVSPKDENLYADIKYDIPCINNDDKIENILKIVRTSINEIHASRKLILYLFTVNTNLNETLQQNEKISIDNYVTKCEEIKLLKTKMQELNNFEETHIKYVNSLIKHKESLKDCLQNIIKSRGDLDTSLSELNQKWDKLLAKSDGIFMTDKCICEELKHAQVKKTHLENTLLKHYICHFQNIKPMQNILWEQFLWSEQKLKDNCSKITKNEQVLHISSDTFSNEKTIIAAELHKNTMLQKDIIQLQNEMDDFSNLLTSFEINCKSNKMILQSESKKKLQLNINELTENKNDLESKLNCACIKNKKLEDNISELKIKIQEIKETSLKEVEDLKKVLIQLKEENLKLQEERNELSKRPKKEDVDNQLKDINDKYKLKLDEIKQNMKTAYNEQIAKQNREQEQRIQENLESLQRKMELQCRKQADELSKYKAHVASMSSQFWNVGEKLLSEQQEKEKLQKELNELKAKYKNVDQKISSIEHKSSKYEKRDLLGEIKEEIFHKIAVTQEETAYERRCSIRSIQTMGNAFNAEDEEGELFDNIYLADMKDGNLSCNIDINRISILKKRNALCKPHLKSSYPAEMQFHPRPFTEEEIKTGSVSDDIFNDSLSQSLLPEQKAKKKDRTQTSYKKPGPPTPSKNGGRLSSQGSELRSPNSRILKERNKDRTSATPRTLKSLFMSKRQDESVVVTPRGRKRSSIFRKHRGTNDR